MPVAVARIIGFAVHPLSAEVPRRLCIRPLAVREPCDSRLVREARITWGVPEAIFGPHELALSRGEPSDLLAVAGFTEAELSEIARAAPVPVKVRQAEGSVGVGASAYGVDLVFQIMGTVADVAGLIVLGEYLRRLIERMRPSRGEATIGDPETLGAVAAASAPTDLREMLVGSYMVQTVPITAAPESGTDARDIWASCFAGDGFAVVIFMSPSSVCLGCVVVPSEWALVDGEYRSRTPEEIAQWWREHPAG